MKMIVSGGGTGGHIYPALSLVDYMEKNIPSHEALYVGTEEGLESQIVTKKGVPFKSIRVQGFKRSLSPDNVKTVYYFMKAVQDSKKLIEEFQPDVVVGTGGYVCAPIVYAAHKKGVPTMIHEQNSVPGLANKFLARYVDKVAICFPEAAEYFDKNKTVLTGNPRGQEVASIQPTDSLSQFGFTEELPTILVFGGSRGALTMTRAMMEAMPQMAGKDYQVLFVTGKIYYEDVMAAVSETVKANDKIKIVPYIEEMEKILTNVTLVVGRAGATSLAEITALGLPSILIPSPNVTNDHQTKNAQSVVNHGGAVLLRDDELNGPRLVTEIERIILNPELCRKMAEASKEMGIPDATKRLFDEVYQLIH
ncbi:undecaprenyldiphospho-muramoylpentapeptide beta-N-acetylglucosaminyltransferase [Vagococcus lutrae LBD1]|uniref:UDP-N-acetylglucosamine--N-acetylmuramyl-(pentapeptide) pyrophosphoryl-undecaprenol N-acetylglucosamine transferase n=1 Tax=Vagococcus lutrae LBD1 TaxID=1408226 RepID=V6Q5V8_9ENTE|nr:undecaprenyldiphospho-muramoylpentapeptide beta-N-acetylglucosaminyltransferase [Vagococcus lutrae]EST90137.1 undecaprenyldiphospho-muramoylpentapeptide beta-N-acetylglucosaminyltransferase [Vagococcus lutrae LBD1]